MPAPGTGVLSFGLVAIPVRIHTAIKSEKRLIPSPERGGKIVDIMEALKRKHGKNPGDEKPALAGAAKKKKRLS